MKKATNKIEQLILFILTAFLIICFLVNPVYASQKKGSPRQIDVQTRQAMITEAFQLTNAQRQAMGLQPLTWNDELATATDTRAAELVVLYSHTRPDGTECFTAFPDHRTAGENIQMGNSKSVQSASGAITNWMNSSGHRANILNPSYTSCAISVVQVGENYYWAQCFIGN